MRGEATSPSGASRPIRILAVDHTAGVAPFRRKFDALAKRPGLEVTVLAPWRWIENYREVRLSHEQLRMERGYRLRAGSVIWPGYENRGFFTTGLAGAFRAARPHVLHLWEEPYSLFVLQLLALRRILAPRAPAIFFSSDNMTRDGRYPYRPSAVYRRIEQFAFRECAAGTAVSEEVVEVLRIKGYTGPVEVVPHGLDAEDFPHRGEDGAAWSRRIGLEPPVVGYVGRLLEMKGIDTLLEAFHALIQEPGIPRATLLIVGDGPDREHFVQRAGALGLGDRVQFRPAVPHEDVSAFYRAIDVLVVPSRTTPKLKEQFGRVITEGMASGCVVIGSTSGAIPHVIGDAGLVTAEGDPAALSAALRRVLTDTACRRHLVERGRARVRERFTWDAVTDRLVALYRSLLEK